jgi:hypothetical protein
LVNWNATLSNGLKICGATDDGTWITLRERLKNESIRITEFSIGNQHGVGKIDSNADGYFLGNKTIAILPSTLNINLVAIGYWKNYDDKVRIKWYDVNTMNLVFTEARPLNECGEFLIKNPTN